MPEAIRKCVLAIPGSEIVYSSPDATYFHATVQSFFFGFWDDFYATALPAGGNENQLVINTQSQLRIGSSDFNKNYVHTVNFMQCMKSNKEIEFVMKSGDEPCS